MVKRPYHLSDVVAEEETEDQDGDHGDEQPDEGYIAEAQEEEEHQQAGSQDEHDGWKGIHVPGGSPDVRRLYHECRKKATAIPVRRHNQ